MAGEKVMIVDDNKVFSEELCETLYLCGYDCNGVTDSSSVLTLARRLKPDAILLDLKMPGSNGFQVAQGLKSTQETSGIPIIAMSGYFPIEDTAALLDLHNMDSRVKKPFGISELITELETVLEKKGEKK